MKKNSDFITTAEAATELGVTVRRVQAILNAGRVPGAQKIGRDWMIPRAALAGIIVYCKPGRPPRKD